MTTNDNNSTFSESDTPVVHAAASIIAPDVLAMATDPNPHRYWDTVGKSNPRRRLKLIYATYIDYIAHFETGQNSAMLVWKDQLNHITDTAELLNLEAWTMDEQAKAEQLLLFWSTRETIRSVILQFALFQKIIELHVNAPKLRRETTLMCQMIANWRMVYTAEGIQGPTTLRQVGLSPPGLFSIILDTFHGHYGCFVREMMLHMILEASVATDGQPEFASQVLQTSIDLFKSHRFCFPDIRLFNLVIMAWAGKGQTTVEQFLKITALMKEYEVEPDKASYQLALQMFGDLQTPEGARQAEKMLNQMIKNYVENSAYAQPDLFCFSMVADAWVKSGDPDTNAKVVDLFRQMEVMRDEGMVFGGESYVAAVIHSVLESYGSVPNKEWAAAEAEKFLRTCGHEATAILYVSLVKLYCRCGDEMSVHRLLNEMQGKQIELEPIDYTTLFTSLANSNLDKRVEVATAILNSIKTSPHLMPSTILYNAYLTVLLSSVKKMRFMAMQVLEEMRNNQPESRPDKKTYTTVINAYSRAGDVKTAGNVLRMMYEEYYKTRDESLAPDLIAFNAVLNGYARTREVESIKEAEDFLQDLITMSKDGATNLKPDTYTIVAVLNCYANCANHYGGGKRRQAIKALQLLRDCRKWDVIPNNTCYNATLNTMCKAEMMDDILALYEEMMRDYESGNKGAKPDVITLNSTFGQR
jgi:pentatricopeptide repeat protein